MRKIGSARTVAYATGILVVTVDSNSEEAERKGAVIDHVHDVNLLGHAGCFFNSS